MRFALRTNYGDGAIWLLQDKTVKFPFIKQFNTKGAPVTVVPFYISEAQGSFLCGLRCQPNGNLIGKSVA